MDANSFYASCELCYQPHLSGLPVSVGGDTEARHGIILASNQPAKRFGVKTGMVLHEAKRLCPGLIVLPPNFSRDVTFSRRLRAIYQQHSPLVENYGLDEAWLEITGPGVTLSDGKALADSLRRRVREELGITLSVGVSYNKIFSKLGSDYQKPDATTVISPDNYREIVWPLPVSDLLFVGPRTFSKLRALNIHTIGDLANTPPGLMESRLGKPGVMHVIHARGLDNSPVMPVHFSHAIKSIGNSTTTPVDIATVEDAACVYSLLAESVGTRLREAGMAGRCIQIHARDTRLNIRSCQMTLNHDTSLSGEISRAAMRLFHDRGYAGMLPLRSVGVAVSKLSDEHAPVQMDLLGDTQARDRELALARSVDRIRSRFGTQIIRRASVLAQPAFAGINPHDHHIIHPEQYYAG
jgi:DNA polymerase-4